MTGEAGQAVPARRLELIADPAEGLTVALAAGARAQEVDGDLRASRQSFEQAYQLAERAGDVQAMARAALGLAGLWVSERRTVTGAVLLSGDLPTAASSLGTLCGSDLAQLPRSSSWLGTMNGIVETAALLGDADVSARAYELLRPYAGLPLLGSLGITCFGSMHHALGVASLTSGQPGRAIDHLRAAVQHNTALAHWPAVLVARRRLAQAYRRRGQPGDADAARGELETAAAEAAALGWPAPDKGTERAAECRRVGKKWRLAWRDRSVLMEDSTGMAHLAVLIANPRQEITAADLAAGLAALGAAGDGGSAHPVLDQAAIAEYRNRLKRLDAQLTSGELDDDAAAERDWLVAQLATAAGFGGRVRSFPDQGERARVAVGKAIRRALARITEADPILGEHLRQTVHTGVRCSYWPG